MFKTILGLLKNYFEIRENTQILKANLENNKEHSSARINKRLDCSVVDLDIFYLGIS